MDRLIAEKKYKRKIVWHLRVIKWLFGFIMTINISVKHTTNFKEMFGLFSLWNLCTSLSFYVSLGVFFIAEFLIKIHRISSQKDPDYMKENIILYVSYFLQDPSEIHIELSIHSVY